MRIVSLLPSATEIVCALGLSRQLVGVTHDALRRVRPDLILTQTLCRVCAPDQESVAEIARKISPDITVIALEPTSIEGIFNTISTVGAMTETERRAIALLGRLRGRLGFLRGQQLELCVEGGRGV